MSSEMRISNGLGPWIFQFREYSAKDDLFDTGKSRNEQISDYDFLFMTGKHVQVGIGIMLKVDVCL